MKKTRIIRNVSVIIHLLYLLLGVWGYFGIPSFLMESHFVVPMIYGSGLMATTINATITTVQHAQKQREKDQQERLQTSFSPQDGRSQMKAQAKKQASLFWTLNGLLTFALSLILIFFSFAQAVYEIFRNILDDGGSVDLLAYFKLGDTLTALAFVIVLVFFLLIACLITSLVLRSVSFFKAKRLIPRKEALQPSNTETEDLLTPIVEQPNNGLETMKTEDLPFPPSFEPALEEAPPDPEPIPEAPRPVAETLEEKIHPEQIKPPKEEAERSSEYLEAIKPLVIQVKSKQMTLNLPNPPTFVALPGTQNVAWVQDDALVLYFDYTSKIKSILKECVENNPKKFPFASIEKMVLEGPQGRESTAFYYNENQTLQKLVFPKGCYDVLTSLVPNKTKVEP